MSKHLKLLHPKFKGLAQEVLVHVAHLSSLSGCSWYIASSWRSPEQQWELFKKGRKLVGVDWVRIPGQQVVTNAIPEKTPHCRMYQDEPGSCAIDIALTHKIDGRLSWLPDSDPRWSIIGASVGIAGHKLLTWGGNFRSIKDMPHVELKGWDGI